MADARSEWERMHPGENWEAANSAYEAAKKRDADTAARRAANAKPTQAAPPIRGAGSGGGSGSASSSISSLAASLGLTGGGAAPAAGGASLPLGSVGAGSGGTSIPSVAQAPQSTQMTAQQNPYITQLMGQQQQVFNTPLDFDAERSKMRAENSQRLREAQQQAGAGGGGGLWGAQQQQIQRGQAQEIAGAEAGFGNRVAQQRLAALQAGTGVAGESTRDIATQLASQQAVADLNERSRQANLDYSARVQDIANRGYDSRMSALTQLIGLL